MVISAKTSSCDAAVYTPAKSVHTTLSPEEDEPLPSDRLWKSKQVHVCPSRSGRRSPQISDHEEGVPAHSEVGTFPLHCDANSSEVESEYEFPDLNPLLHPLFSNHLRPNLSCASEEPPLRPRHILNQDEARTAVTCFPKPQTQWGSNFVPSNVSLSQDHYVSLLPSTPTRRDSFYDNSLPRNFFEFYVEPSHPELPGTRNINQYYS